MKVLFVGNTASRTGAPIGLLHLMGWVRENTDIEFELLLRWGGGVIQPEYEKICRVICYSDLWCSRGIHHRVARRLGMRELLGRSCLTPSEETYKDTEIDLVYANTITHGAVLNDLKAIGCPVICHVHELDSEIKRYGKRNLAQVKALTHTYIADSEATRLNLIQNHGIPSEAVEVVYETIVAEDHGRVAAGSSTRKALGLPEDAFIVGGSGYPYWRKGKDLFVQVAEIVNRRNGSSPVHFVWVGGEKDGEDAENFCAAIRDAGMEQHVHVVPQVEDPAPYYASFDLFTLVSREEPFGMVNLEAAMFECPVLCFDGAGGAPEFVEDDAGCCVDYLDVSAMADRVVELMHDDERRRQLGQRAKAKVIERHDISVVAPQVVNIIKRAGAGTPHG